MLDLCKFFEVEDKEEFRFIDSNPIYRVNNNILEFKNNNDWEQSRSLINELNYSDVIKLPKKKRIYRR